MLFLSAETYFVNDYCVLDLETTGLRPSKAEILEVGLLRIRSGRPVSKMEVLIRPHDLPVPAPITRLTGITTGMVEQAPSIDEVGYWIYDFIGLDPVVGYNVGFDLAFLQAHTFKHTPCNRSLDVLPLAQICFPQLSSHSLSAMTEFLHLYQNTHRAFDDCMATFQLYELCKSMLEGWSDDEISSTIRHARSRRRPRSKAV